MRLLYFLISLFLVSCNSVPKEYLVSNSICNYNDPVFEVTKDELNFKYHSLDSILSEKGALYIENDSLTIEIQKNLIGKTDKKTKITKWINYHSNSKIKSISFFLRNSSQTEIGKEKYYNQQGDITKVINYEKGYKICWAEAIEIVKKIARRDIKKYDIDRFYLSRTDLNEFPNSNPEWRISMKGNEEYNERNTKFYVIDGVTGKLNRTYKTRLIYDSIDD